LDDHELLDRSLLRLKTEGQIEYTGEYGAEITTFIPFTFWLKTQGLLEGRRIVTYRGMRPYYYFLEDSEFAEKAGNRDWLPPDERGWPTNWTYTATRKPWHVMPDYRARYAEQGRTFDRPVLFIQNKFAIERDLGPVNYMPLRSLREMFSLGPARFDVVYSRPGAAPKGEGYVADPKLNDFCDYPDMALARSFEGVTILEDLCAQTGADYNLTKLEILAKAHFFVAVQGGGAHILACFGNSLMLLLHYLGEEDPHAYAAGPYKYLSDPPPALIVARTPQAFHEGAQLVLQGRLRKGEVYLVPMHRETLDALRV
jgi:hypothetical protein